MPQQSSSPRYLSVAETAKLVRVAVKIAFPHITFKVRSKSYSMGATITIDWTDGPTQEMVRQIGSRFESRGFDGTIDLAYDKYHWLCPDGTLAPAKSTGTTGSLGTREGYNHAAPCPGAELVSLGSSSVSPQRRISAGLLQRVADRCARKYGIPRLRVIGGDHCSDFDRNDPNSSLYLEAQQRYIGQLIHHEVHRTACIPAAGATGEVA